MNTEAVSNAAPLLWDLAGWDGLAVARDLFGPSVSELAAYQSLDTEWAGNHGAVLRLCENNFRVGLCRSVSADVETALRAAAAGRRVWVKSAGLATLVLPEGPDWDRLEQIATTKAPHRLAGLPFHRAVPARLAGHAALLWRHGLGGAAVTEIQMACADREAIAQCLWERS